MYWLIVLPFFLQYLTNVKENIWSAAIIITINKIKRRRKLLIYTLLKSTIFPYCRHYFRGKFLLTLSSSLFTSVYAFHMCFGFVSSCERASGPPVSFFQCKSYRHPCDELTLSILVSTSSNGHGTLKGNHCEPNTCPWGLSSTVQ
jgi:hypothetical protein